MRRSSAEPPFFSPPPGQAPEEDEGLHLQRVASELNGANAALLASLRLQLVAPQGSARTEAAAGLGRLGSREAMLALRLLLEGNDPEGWAVAIYGLREAKEREGWLCLESVALEQVPALASPDRHICRRAALRLLMMGRTKTMDRLFRASDGHSRSIPQVAAQRFVEAAVASLPEDQGRVMSLRLGAESGPPLTPQEVAIATGLSEALVRDLESAAWVTVQSPRPFSSFVGAGLAT